MASAPGRWSERDGGPDVMQDEPTTDTAARSLAHWSEAGRAEMDAFYNIAAEDYRQLALAADWPSVLRTVARPGWRLLDVACGSGKFPNALYRYTDLSDLPVVAYDLLDPSAFSIAEARGQLRSPFRAADEYLLTLQELPDEVAPYDVVWATHALYALPPEQLTDASRRFVRAVAKGGIGVVAQATSASHYLAFYDAFRAADHARTRYLCAEEIRDALEAQGVQVRAQTLHYTSGSPDRTVVEGFLQRCAFDGSLSLEDMDCAPVLGDYLAGCRSPAGWYEFRHEVMLLWI